MPKPTKTNLNLFVMRQLSRSFRFVLVLLALTGVFLYTRVGTPSHVQAATSSTINFQARLLTGAGSIVPDGTYNVQFNLYNVSTGGSSLWSETYYDSNGVTAGNDNRVQVRAGYLTVNLGAQTAFPALNWDQDLYLTMNIGGTTQTATPTWDGEMTPRLKLTAVPYAMSAGNIAKQSGAQTGTLSFNTVANSPNIKLPDITGTNNVLLQSGTTLFTQGSIPFTDASGLLQQDNANFYFDDTNNTLGIGSTRTGAIDGTGNSRLVVKGSGTSSATSSLNVTNSSNTSLFFVRDDGNIGIGTTSPTATLHVVTANQATAGANAVQSLQVTGGIGGATNGTGQVGGIGSSINLTAGQGGTGQASSTAGNGGSITLQGGAPGSANGGAVGAYGNLLLNPNGGNVGIGTLTPGQKLTVKDGYVELDASTLSTVAPEIHFKSYNGRASDKLSWVMGIDVSAPTPSRDFVIGKAVSAGITDDFYGNYRGNNLVSTWAFGQAPADNAYKLSVVSGVTGGSTTIAAASNGVSLPQATINVASTAGFASSGYVLVTTSNGAQWVSYTGITGTSFTGASGGTGTMSTGGPVGDVAMGGLKVQIAGTTTGNALTLKDGSQDRVWVDNNFWLKGQGNVSGASVQIKADATNARTLALGMADGTGIFGFEHNTGSYIRFKSISTATNIAQFGGDGSTYLYGLTTLGAGGELQGGNLTIQDNRHLVLGISTGTMIGTATNQKLGFYGATPIIQPSNTTDLRQALINLGLYASGGATPLNLNGGALTAGTNGLTVGTNQLVVSGGNVGVGTATFGTSAAGVFALGQATAPSTSPADNVQLYVTDAATGDARLRVRMEGGGIVTFPNETGTICTTGSVCSGYASAATNGYVQFAPASVQADTTTNSSIFINKTGASGNILQLQRSSADKLVVDNSGNVGIGTTSIGTNNKLIVNTYSTVDNLATTQINTNAATNKGLVIQGFASQSADLLQIQKSDGTVQVKVDNTGQLFLNGSGANALQRVNATTSWIFSDQGANQLNTIVNGGWGYPVLNSGSISVAWGLSPGYGLAASLSVDDNTGTGARTLSSWYFDGTNLAGLSVSPYLNSHIGLIVKGQASQSASLFELKNSVNTTLSKFDGSGNLSVGTSTSPTGGVATFNGNVGIGTTGPTSVLHTVATGAKTANYTGNLLTNTATSSTASINKYGLEIQSTGTWNGTSANNVGLYVSSVSGGTNNYDAIFNGGGNVGIGLAAPTAKLHVQAEAGISSGATTMTATSGATTFTTSASITLNAGDLILPTASTSRYVAIATTATGTSFTVSQAFGANITAETFTIYRRALQVNSPGFPSNFTVQGYTGRVGIGPNVLNPVSELSNSETNVTDTAGTGVGPFGFLWDSRTTTTSGYAAVLRNSSNLGSQSGLLISTRQPSNTTFPLRIETGLVGSTTTRFVVRGDGNVGIGTSAPTSDLAFGGDVARTIKLEVNTGNTAGNNLTVAAGGGGAGASAVAGGQLILQGGAAGGSGTAANGGAVTISGGAGVGTGAQGLVNLSTTAFSSASVQTFGSSAPITAGNIDLYSTLPVTASTTGVVVTVPDPVQSVTGRLVYIAARSGSNDFTLRFNSARTPIDIAMKANSTATLIWNGTDWTAAGASSSTDLQSAYNNTLTSAGGAELVLNASGGAADGLTIRNNATTPISGGILEVQSAIGTNLFSVNNFGTELAANGGSETSSTFATNWTAAPAGGTVTRTTTAGQFVTGLAGAQVVTTTTANTGIRNNLSGNPVNTIGAVYQVSFTAKSSLSGTPIDVVYSRDGGTNLTSCTNYGASGAQNLSNTVWTKITCTITIASATAATDPDLYIRKTDGTTAPTIYIDNLSFVRNDTTTQPSNVQIGGGINGGPVTLFTLDRSSAPPVANGNTTYYGSMYYDTTTGRIQCYEADGWGACGSAPDNIITLTPEYTGAVLNGSGIGTMTADFCGNGGGLSVNTTFCASGEARSYYRWTSPQATDQTYSIYVNYKLPSTFKEFIDDNTIKLTAYKDHATNAGATLDVYRKNVVGGTITQCGNSTTITTGTSAWNTTSLGGSGEQSSCVFAAGDYVIFKITVTAKNAANVYIENLDFTFTNK